MRLEDELKFMKDPVKTLIYMLAQECLDKEAQLAAKDQMIGELIYDKDVIYAFPLFDLIIEYVCKL